MLTCSATLLQGHHGKGRTPGQAYPERQAPSALCLHGVFTSLDCPSSHRAPRRRWAATGVKKAALPRFTPTTNHFTSTLPCFPLFSRMTHWGKTIGILTFLHKSYLDPSNGFWTSSQESNTWQSLFSRQTFLRAMVTVAGCHPQGKTSIENEDIQQSIKE